MKTTLLLGTAKLGFVDCGIYIIIEYLELYSGDMTDY